MKAGHVAAIYGVSVLGAAAVSYFRGRQGTDILFDAALHGAVVGTGLTIIGYFFEKHIGERRFTKACFARHTEHLSMLINHRFEIFMKFG